MNNVISLASIFAFRMLGLFMVLPVFTLYMQQIAGATPKMIGLALGIYGLTQALFQIPLGMLSDRIGRKPVITIGLVIFIAGSAFAAMATTIHGIIIGRALQGAGAIGSVIIALTADLTRIENRTKAMAVIGITIGFSFILAMILGPLVNAWIGLSGIFWLTALLALLGIIILYVNVPSPPQLVFHQDSETVPSLFKTVLSNFELLRLNFGILTLHATLTASFIAIPIILKDTIGLTETHHWYFYLPVLILAFFAMFPFIIAAEKKRKMKAIFLLAIGALICSQLGLWKFHGSFIPFAILLFIFFTAFTLLEACLPSLVSKISTASSKGTAMGCYSSSQFLGIFIGGALGGVIYKNFGLPSIFLACGILLVFWLAFAAFMKKPPYLSTYLLAVGQINETTARNLSRQLLRYSAVAEAAIAIEEGVAYLKVDNKMVDKDELQAAVRNFSSG